MSAPEDPPKIIWGPMMAMPKLPISTKPLVPWYVLMRWRIHEWITWPVQVRQLKRAGFVRTGWRKWEYPGPS